MPPQSGWGMGLDRMFSILTEQPNVRDVIFFPMMKPVAGDHSDTDESNETSTNKLIS